jgi:2-polyprenyl-6-methoxyphenol hydroxylase-like FAD-dependent oxidoreductase
MLAKISPEVLVVGAGPVGLLAALVLAERGVHVQIVDRDWRTGAHSYALALHPATVRLLAELELAQSVLEKAYRVEGIGLYDGHQRRKELKLSAVDEEYPYVAVMPQDIFERALETALNELGVEVLWNHEVAGLVQHSDHVAVTINQLEKQSVGYAVAHTEWVVAKTTELNVPLVLGADGHRSAVRRSLGIEFPEVGPAQNFAVFEFQSGAELENQMQLVMADHLTSALWPLPYGYCRWSFQLGDVPIPVASRQKRRVTVEIGRVEFPVLDASQFGTMIAQRAPWFSTAVEEIRWQIAVRFERRLASRFGHRRLWLAGDAGHMTGPVGMQSMNVGLREAHELAHLFEGVLGGGVPLERLENYNRQRTDQWRHLLGLTGGLQTTDALDPWLGDHREQLLPCLPASGADLTALARQLGFAG